MPAPTTLRPARKLSETDTAASSPRSEHASPCLAAAPAPSAPSQPKKARAARKVPLAEQPAQAGAPTTMMLRNLAPGMTTAALRLELERAGFAGSFDFLVVPVNAQTGQSSGFAFVNFVAAAEALRLKQQARQLPETMGAVSVGVAHLQGLEANIKHYLHRACTMSKKPSLRPLVLQDGKQLLSWDVVRQRYGKRRSAAPQPAPLDDAAATPRSVQTESTAATPPRSFSPAPHCAVPEPCGNALADALLLAMSAAALKA